MLVIEGVGSVKIFLFRKIVMWIKHRLGSRFQAGVFIIEVLKATTRQPCPEEETTATDEAPIRPNLSVGEEGGQEKSTTSQFSEKATTQPNPREGIEEPASIKIEKKPLYRKILRPHQKEEEEVINEESEVEDSEALSPLKDKSKPIAQKGEDEAPWFKS
jgi:hypothetical protein